jgi:hypothetical protein
LSVIDEGGWWKVLPHGMVVLPTWTGVFVRLTTWTGVGGPAGIVRVVSLDRHVYDARRGAHVSDSRVASTRKSVEAGAGRTVHCGRSEWQSQAWGPTPSRSLYRLSATGYRKSSESYWGAPGSAGWHTPGSRTRSLATNVRL